VLWVILVGKWQSSGWSLAKTETYDLSFITWLQGKKLLKYKKLLWESMYMITVTADTLHELNYLQEKFCSWISQVKWKVWRSCFNSFGWVPNWNPVLDSKDGTSSRKVSDFDHCFLFITDGYFYHKWVSYFGHV